MSDTPAHLGGWRERMLLLAPIGLAVIALPELPGALAGMADPSARGRALALLLYYLLIVGLLLARRLSVGARTGLLLLLLAWGGLRLILAPGVAGVAPIYLVVAPALAATLAGRWALLGLWLLLMGLGLATHLGPGGPGAAALLSGTLIAGGAGGLLAALTRSLVESLSHSLAQSEQALGAARRRALEEVARKVRYAEALAACSRALLTRVASEDEYRSTLEGALRTILEATGAGRIAVFQYAAEGHIANAMTRVPQLNLLAACNHPDIPAHPMPGPEVVADFPFAISQAMAAGEAFNGPARFPGHPDFQRYNDQNQVRAVCFQPLFVEGRWWGHVSLNNYRDDRAWDEDSVRTLRTAGEMIVAFTLGWEATRRLNQREALLSSVSDTLPDGYLYQVFHSPDGSLAYTYVSRSIEQLFNLSPAELVARPELLHQTILPEDRARVRAADAEAVRSGSTFDVELRGRKADGRVGWFHVRSAPQQTLPDGRTLWNGITLEVTARKEAELALAAREAELRALRDALPDLLFVLGRDGTFLSYHAPRGSDLLLPGEQLLGRKAQEVLPPDLAGQLAAALARAAGDEIQRIEYTLAIGDTERWFEARVAAISAERALVLVRDISDRRAATLALEQARDAAEAAARAKTTFLAAMSHEIRTPLNAVIGMAQLLLDTELSPQQRDYVGPIITAGEALLSAINNVLDLSRGELGHVELESRPFDLQACLRGSLELIAAEAREKGLGLHLDVAPGVPPFVVGDANRLRQVLLNLLANAVKFTEAGEVRLRVTAAEGGPSDPRPALIFFEVADTGIGIAPEQLGQIFEPFVQVDSSAIRRYGGSGLGLAIVRWLVEQMEGQIAVESRPGLGSCFRVGLPLAPAAAPPAGPPPDTPPAARPLRVLVAEDNLVNQELVRQMLLRAGHSVVVVGNGLAVIAALEREPYDVVLMDVQMPELDGEAATRQIRARAGGLPQPKIIALTAAALPGDRARLLAAGMDGYLRKPLLRESLLRALDQVAAGGPAYAAPPEPLVDWEVLRRFGGRPDEDDAELIGEAIGLFASDTPPLLEALGAALCAGDQERAHAIAHRLRGGCLQLGAQALASRLRAIEADGPAADPAAQAAELLACFQQTLAVLRGRA